MFTNREVAEMLLHQREFQERLMSAIADLTTAVGDLITAVASIPAATGATVLDPNDQAALDTAVAGINQVVVELNALTAPAAPVEPTV